jgi:hypothetical protein
MYTIQFLLGGEDKRNRVLAYLEARLAKDGRYRCHLQADHVAASRADQHLGSGAKRIGSVPAILVQKVRLVKAKPYCGNHPGECPVSSKPKPVSTRLEWEDWVKFHSIVNKVLNRFKALANVWTLPYDVKGRMWIRKGLQARVHYDWEEKLNRFNQLVREWNPGTDDQFQKAS